MADSYILNVKPVISNSDGRKMENDLNQRFRRVAQKFSGALKTAGSAFKGLVAGGIVSAIGLIGSMLNNPIDKLNTALNNTLNKADNIATRAGQLGTTSGRLIQVQAVAESAGVKNFDMIISRFQTELEKARRGENDILKEFVKKKEPTEEKKENAGFWDSVKNVFKTEKEKPQLEDQDTLDTFLDVIESLKQLKPQEQNYMISKIFGERANLQLAEFIQADLGKRREQIFGKTTTEELDVAVNKLGEKEDLQAILAQKTAVEDLLNKSRMITEGTIRMQAEHQKAMLRTENAQFSMYADFSKMAIAQEEAKATLAEMQAELTPLITKGVDYLEKGYEWAKGLNIKSFFKGVFR